jgi:hypothetical protein
MADNNDNRAEDVVANPSPIPSPLLYEDAVRDIDGGSDQLSWAQSEASGRDVEKAQEATIEELKAELEREKLKHDIALTRAKRGDLEGELRNMAGIWPS